MSKIIRSMHAIAARRGDGLLPELAALLERREYRSEVASDSNAITKKRANADFRARNTEESREIGILSKVAS